jgi:hypothetical protein
MEERNMRVFENRVVRRMFGTRGRKWRETGEDCIMRSFLSYTLHLILGRSNEKE